MSCACWSGLTACGFPGATDGLRGFAVEYARAMCEFHPPGDTLDLLAADLRRQRRAALRALNVLEYALAAPAPRRQRTWLHRVTVAIDALHAALVAQIPAAGDSLQLLDRIALFDPAYLPRVQQLQQELLSLTVAVASLHERVEPEPTIEIDPTDVRDRLSLVTKLFREHQAREADLVYEAIGLDLQEEFGAASELQY
jgi:hypothetical protein